ncbi:MAG: GNAT family N-acetyltransferase [Candidatus Dormibacterales bacterium]
MPNEISTPRLRLRLVSPEEAADLLLGRQDPELPWAEGYPLEGTRDAARGLIFAAGAGEPGGFGMYQVIRLEDGHVVGDIGFHGPPARDGSVTVGYGIAASARRQGYATEALRAIIDWALVQAGVFRVKADTTHENLASRRVLEGAGMVLVGRDRRLRYYAIP